MNFILICVCYEIYYGQMGKVDKLNTAKKSIDDEFYTLLTDIEKELSH